MKKILLFLALGISAFAFAATEEVATITISGTVTTNKTLKDSKGNEWSFVANPVSNLAGESGAIKLGSNSKNALSLSFESSAYATKWVKSIEIEGYSNEGSSVNTTVYPYLYINDSLVNKGESFYSTSKVSRTVTNANQVIGKVRFTMERSGNKQKAIFFYSAKITYCDVPDSVNSLSLDKDTLELLELTSSKLTATVDPSTASVTWTSLDEDIATVDNGVVRGEHVGTTYIVATAGDKADTCIVVVQADESIVGKSFQIVFNSSSQETDEDFSSLTSLIFKGEKYVESYSKDGYAVLAASDNGVKLGSNKQAGTLSLTLKQDARMHVDSVRVFAKGHADNNPVIVNGSSKATTTAFSGYTFPLSDNIITLKANSSKQVYVSKVTVYYREFDVVELEELQLSHDTLILEKGASDNLIVTLVPDSATEQGVTWTCSDNSKVQMDTNGLQATLTGVALTSEPILVIATSVDKGKLADTCYVIVKDRTLKEPVYTMMLSTDSLLNGDKIMIGRQVSGTLMETYLGGNNIPAISGTFNDAKTQVEEMANSVYTLEIVRQGVYAFKDQNGLYLCHSSQKGNCLQATSTMADSAQWYINKVTDGACDLRNVANDAYYMQYNSNAGIFACYNSYMGYIYLYYRHDEKAGSITPDTESIAWQARIQDSAAAFSQEVAVEATHLTQAMTVQVVQDSIVPGTYPETRYHHQGIFATSMDNLPAEGGKTTITFTIQQVGIMAADTTIQARLIFRGVDGNDHTQEKVIPITVTLLREPKKILPVSITTILTDSINQMGGIHMQNSTKEIAGKDTFLIDTLTVLYVAPYEVIAKDATGYLAISSKQSQLKAGDIITGVRGRLMGAYKRYYFQLIESDIAVVDSTIVAPEVTTQVPTYPADMSRYLQYDSVQISGSNIVLPNQHTLAVVENYGVALPTIDEAYYQVQGIATIDGKTIQLILTQATIDPSFRRPVSGIAISTKELTIVKGQSATLTATVFPEGENPTGAYNKNVLWSTSRPSMLDITSDGVITAKAEGQALVMVTAEDQTKGVFTDTCVVTVTADDNKYFRLVTEASSLKPGNRILLVDSVANEAAGVFGTKNFSDAAITRLGDTITYHLDDTATIFTLGKDGEYWTLLVGGNKVGLSTTESKYMTIDGTGTTTWTITFNDSAAVVHNAATTYSSYSNILHNGGANIFSVYGEPNVKNRMYPIQIYMDIEEHDSVYVDSIALLYGGKAIDSIAMMEAETVQLTALIIPDNADNQEVVWSSSNDTVASVINGLVSANRYGQATIYACSKENPAIVDSCVISITAISGSRYDLLTASDTLHAGDKLIIVNKDAAKANGSRNNGKYLAAVDVHIAGTTVVSNEVTDITLSGSEGAWILTADSRLGNKTNDNDFVDNTSATYTISIDENNNAKIVSSIAGEAKNSNTIAEIAYNGSDSGRFALYTNGTMGKVQLYRLTRHEEVPIPVVGVTLNSQSATLRVGDTLRLEATVLPEDAKNQNITWGVVEETIAMVDSGLVTALAVGEARVWVRTEEGAFTDTCVLTIRQSLNLPDVSYRIVQQLDSLHEGVKVFFGNPAQDYVMGVYDYDRSKSNILGQAAIYDTLHHVLTASESYAYIVHKVDNQFYFEDVDGRYLYMYNTNNNLSAATTLNNQAKWTVAIEDSVATIKSVYSSSFQIFYNRTAAKPMYNTYTALGTNNAPIYLYSDNAPEWIEPVLYPEMTIKVGNDTITDRIDWGKVIYDDSWGTETNPYEESKQLNIITNKDVRDSIYLRLQSGKVFNLYTTRLSAKGGQASIQFSTKDAGTYSDSLFIDCGLFHYAIELTAQTATAEDIAPKLTLSTAQITLYPDTVNHTDTAFFTFSVENLAKNLYVKWENSTGNSIPSYNEETTTIFAAGQEVFYGAVTNLGTDARANDTVTISTYAYNPGTYTSTLYFYSFKEGSKDDKAFEKRVQISIVVNDTVTPQPTAERVVITYDEQSIDTLSLSISQGIYESQQLSYRIEPADAQQPNVGWHIDDTSIATVDETGLVQAVAEGTTLLILTTDYGTPDTCVIVVTEEEVVITGEYFVKVQESLPSWVGRYLIVYDEDALAMDGSLTTFDQSYNTQSVTIEWAKAVAVDATTKAISFTIDSVEAGYTVRAKSGKYIDYDPDDTEYQNKNGILGYDTPRPLTISYADSIQIMTPLGNMLKYNPNKATDSARGELFRFYRETAQGMLGISLYRYIGTEWPKDDPQGVDTISEFPAEGKARILIQNGTLWIEKDGQRYTILGFSVGIHDVLD